MRDTVSVVVPTRDRASLLRRAVLSALAQTAPPLEVIIVDDASTDDTPDAAARLAQEDPRVRTLTVPEAAGAAAARNRGVAVARGDWVALLDDDDEWLPEKLALQLHAAAAAGDRVGLVHGGFEEVAADGSCVRGGLVSGGPERLRRLLVRGNRIGHSTVIVRRALLLECGGYDERLPRLQDWDLWLRLAARTGVAHVGRVVARIHRGPVAISADPARLVVAARLLAEKHAAGPGAAGLTPGEQADLLLTLGRLLTRAGQEGAAAPFLRRAAVAWPWSPRRALAATLLERAPALFDRAEILAARFAGGAR
ncbi:MAG TPA: glycosyltransferase family A protein [Longimicrobiales bacterium]|nr:glycosyltransferase family A protein [Longimicrobiales bacterium]